MKLRDLTAEQAQQLGSEYLKQLMLAGADQMNSTQMAIHNGLYFYGDVEYCKLQLNSSSVVVRRCAQETIDKWNPKVLEWEPFVNKWLEENYICKQNIEETSYE